MKHTARMNTKTGFTVMELLIAIAIIGILAVVVLLVFDPILQVKKSHDVDRKVALKQVAGSLQEYVIATGNYTPIGTGPSATSGWACVDNASLRGIIDLGSLKSLPTDPTRKTTCPCLLYAVNATRQRYALFAQLENFEDPDASSPKPTPDPSLLTGTPNATNTLFTINSGTCAGSTYNYWITSSAPGFVATGPPVAGGGVPPPPAPPPPPPGTPTPTPAGLVANWKFDEAPGSTTFSDSSGNNLTGNVNGLRIVSAGCRFGSCLQNTGMNAFSSVPYNSLFNITQNVTYNVWAKLRAKPSSLQWPHLLGRYSHVGYGIRENEGNNGWNTYFEWGKSPCDGSLYTSNPFTLTANDGNWHMHTMTQDGSVIKLYLDGVPVGAGASFSPFCSDTSSDVALGGPYFTGKIDEAKIYSKALTDSEVLTLYNTFPQAVVPTPPTNGLVGYWNMDDIPSWNGTSGEVKDSAGTNHGTATNATNTTDSFLPAYGKTGNFNGTDTSVELGAGKFDSLTDATVSLWMYYTGTFTDNKVFFSKYKDGSNRLPIFVGASSLPAPYPKKIVMELWSTNPSTESHGILSDNPINENTWYHVVVTCGSSGMTMYVNGIKQTQVDPTTRCFHSLGATITNSFGQHGTGNGFPFPGYIDDVRIYDRILSTAEVETIFNANPPPTLSTNLALHLKMDESSWNGTSGEVKDSSGNTNHGVASCSGAGCTIPTTISGKFGNAGTFAANGLDTVTIPSNSAFAFDAAGEYTASVWLNPNSFVNHPNGTAIIALTNTGDGWSLRANGAGVFWVHFPGSTCGACSSSSTTLPTGIWSHAVFTYKNGSVNLYLNGTNILSTNVTDAISVTHDMNIAYGNPACAGYGACAYNGKMDDLRIYSRALSASEVSTLYAYTPPDITSNLAGHWKMDENSWTNDCSTASVSDSSSNSNHGKSCPSGIGPTGGAAGKFSNAGNFDGVDDYITMNASASLDNIPKITVSAWVKPDVTSGWPNIVSKYVYADGGWILRSSQAGSGLFTPHIYANGQWHLCSGASVPTASWTHLALTYDGDTLRGYVNGIETCTNTNPSGDLSSNTTPVKIGGVPAAPGEYFDGKTDDVRIYNRALTDSEVSTLYAYTPPAPPTCPSTGLAANWKFDEGSGTTASDAVGGNNATLYNFSFSGNSNWTNTSKFGKAISIDGTQPDISVPLAGPYPAVNYIHSPNTTNPINLPTAGTVSLWANPRSFVPLGGPNNGGAGRGLFINHASPSGAQYRIGIDSTGVTAILSTPSQTYNYVNGSTGNPAPPITLGNWYHIVLTYDSSLGTDNARLYINDIYVAKATIAGPLRTAINKLVIGASDTNGYQLFDGIIDDVRVYNRALSSIEVATLNTCTP